MINSLQTFNQPPINTSFTSSLPIQTIQTPNAQNRSIISQNFASTIQPQPSIQTQVQSQVKPQFQSQPLNTHTVARPTQFGAFPDTRSIRQ